MHRFVLLCITVMLAACDFSSPRAVGGDDIAYSDISGDEHVVFFRTAAWLDEENAQWHVPIHGWIYEPEDSTSRKELLATLLSNQYGLAPDRQTDENFTRRVNLMIADNEREKQIVVTLAGRNHVLPASHANGQFETTLTIPSIDAARFAEGALLEYSAVTRDNESRKFSGAALLVSPDGLSIISDIDDTVKLTNVGDRKSLLENTFLLDFRAVPDMAKLYNQWSDNDVSLHFVSSSPWQLYSPLQEFLDSNHFPWSTLSLKQVRFRDETLFNLFKKGTETKPEAIEKILNNYAGRKFVLVGDSGEQDPEVYSSLMRKHPQQILEIYIRNVTQESANDERFKVAFAGIDKDRWQLFENPLTLALPE